MAEGVVGMNEVRGRVRHKGRALHKGQRSKSWQAQGGQPEVMGGSDGGVGRRGVTQCGVMMCLKNFAPAVWVVVMPRISLALLMVIPKRPACRQWQRLTLGGVGLQSVQN